jgi:uncharacterized membrane protein YgaE (UPF0421/DUF939 family)
MKRSQTAKLLGIDRKALFDSARTALATLVSLLLARALKLPEYYWAPISTVIIMQSSAHQLAYQGQTRALDTCRLQDCPKVS